MSNLPPGLGDQIGSLFAGSQLGPDIQATLQQLFGAQLAQPMAQQGLDTTLANQQYGDTLAQLGIQGGTLGREQKYLPQQQALQKQLLGLSGQELGLQRSQLGLRGNSLNITEAEQRAQEQRSEQGTWSSATARGATNTQGMRNDLGYEKWNLGQQLAQNDLSRQGLGLEWQGLGIQGNRLGIEGQQQDISNILQSGALQDQLAQLGLNYNIAGQTQQNALGQSALNAATGTTNIGLGQIQSGINAAAAVPQGAGPAAIAANASPVQSPTPLLPGRT